VNKEKQAEQLDIFFFLEPSIILKGGKGKLIRHSGFIAYKVVKKEIPFYIQTQLNDQEYAQLMNDWLNSIPKWERALPSIIYHSMFTSYNCSNGNIEEVKKDILEIVKTRCYHMGQSKDNYIYSVWYRDSRTMKKIYHLIFQIGNRICFNRCDFDNPLEGDIHVPAMMIMMFDLQGNPIHFENRVDFIENKLGYATNGKLLNCFHKNEPRMFCNCTCTLNQIIKHLALNGAEGEL
jgi:hypothetical protein